MFLVFNNTFKLSCLGLVLPKHLHDAEAVSKLVGFQIHRHTPGSCMSPLEYTWNPFGKFGFPR